MTKEGRFITMTQICYSLLDAAGNWQPLNGDDCDNRILSLGPNGIYGIGISLENTSTTLTYDVYTTAGVFVGTGKFPPGDRIGNATTPITGADIQFSPRNLHLKALAFDKNFTKYEKHENELIGDKAVQLVIMQLSLKR